MQKPSHKSKQHPKSPQNFVPPRPLGGEVRIIGGKWRGRKLPVAKVPGLRPTPNRIRETLFNWLQADVVGAICCDLYCGSGALGIEAASRGADSVVLIDNHKEVASIMTTNLQKLNHNDLQFVAEDVMRFLQQNSKKYDLIFLDPPFKRDLVNATINSIDLSGCLNDNAKIYIETEAEMKNIDIPDNWHLLKQKTHGQVCYRLFQFSQQSQKEKV